GGRIEKAASVGLKINTHKTARAARSENMWSSQSGGGGGEDKSLTKRTRLATEDRARVWAPHALALQANLWGTRNVVDTLQHGFKTDTRAYFVGSPLKKRCTPTDCSEKPQIA